MITFSYIKSLRELKLRPGVVTLTWTSMNIDGYKQHVYAGLAALEDLVLKIHDIVESRIQKNLKSLSRSILGTYVDHTNLYELHTSYVLY